MMYRAWRVAVWLASRLPLRISYGLAAVVGTLTFIFWPRGRRATTANFRAVLQTSSRIAVYRTAWLSLVNYCKYIVDFARLPELAPDALRERVLHANLYGELLRWLDNGRGVLIVCFHYGNWDMGAAGAPLHGLPLTVIVEPFADPRLDRDVVSGRTRLGMRAVPMDAMGPSLLRELKRGDMLAVLVDRPVPPAEGVTVDWFGEAVTIPAGPARIALRTGAKVVPAAFTRENPWSDTVRIIANFDVELPCDRNQETAVQELTQRIVNAQAEIVRQHPEQWYMFRRFGRRR